MIVALLIFWISLAALVFGYVGYPILILLLARLRPRPDHPGPCEPTVTIIVAAYNEAGVIRPKLESILALDYPKEKLETLVLTDGSTDGTDAIVEEYADRGITLRAAETNAGKLTRLNEHTPTAQGEIVVFSDAAAVLAPDAIRQLVRHFADPEVGCVAGHYDVSGAQQAAGGRQEQLYWRYETAMRAAEGRVSSALGAHGALYAIRKALYPGLPPGTINDDYFIPVAIVAAGFRAVYEPAAHAVEPAVEMEGFHRHIRISMGNWQQLALLRRLARGRKWGPLLQFLAHKALRLGGPVFLLGLLGACGFLPGPFYRALLLAQGAFYMLGVAGMIRAPRTKWLLPVRFAAYFCRLNAAIVVALWYLGRRRRVWDEREPQS